VCPVFLLFRSRVVDDLMLHTNVSASIKKRFRFEAIWPRFLGYMEAVAEGWQFSVPNADSCRILDRKLRLAIAHEVVFKLDQAQD
jgi:hypothetical protein